MINGVSNLSQIANQNNGLVSPEPSLEFPNKNLSRNEPEKEQQIAFKQEVLLFPQQTNAESVMSTHDYVPQIPNNLSFQSHNSVAGTISMEMREPLPPTFVDDTPPQSPIEMPQQIQPQPQIQIKTQTQTLQPSLSLSQPQPQQPARVTKARSKAKTSDQEDEDEDFIVSSSEEDDYDESSESISDDFEDRLRRRPKKRSLFSGTIRKSSRERKSSLKYSDTKDFFGSSDLLSIENFTDRPENSRGYVYSEDDSEGDSDDDYELQPKKQTGNSKNLKRRRTKKQLQVFSESEQFSRPLSSRTQSKTISYKEIDTDDSLDEYSSDGLVTVETITPTEYIDRVVGFRIRSSEQQNVNINDKDTDIRMENEIKSELQLNTVSSEIKAKAKYLTNPITVPEPLNIKWESDDVEYLIKWMNKSHLHNSWRTYSSCLNTGSIKKLHNFVKNTKNELLSRLSMSAEEIERVAIEAEQTNDILLEQTRVERIISVRYSEPSKAEQNELVNAEQKNDNWNENNSLTLNEVNPSEPEYLVLWKRLGYDECTWEKRSTIQNFAEEIDSFEQFEKEIQTRTNPRITPTKHIPIPTQPTKIINGTLRDYQIEGVNWLTYGFVKNVNGILADEMGLGKTVQTIAFLQNLKELYGFNGPYIIIVPLTTLNNWLSEFHRWCPSMNTIVYTGNSKSRETIREYEFFSPKRGRGMVKFNVLLTTYEIAMKDRDYLNGIRWVYLIIDEAQRIKNIESQLSVCLREFTSSHRLLITGTPLQNSIRELWALLSFLMPNKFTSLEEFEEKYSDLSDPEHSKIAELHTLIQPHLLRRIKRDVEKYLPQKKEQILRVEASSLQKQYYRYIVTRNAKALNEGARAGSKVSLLNVVVELKKVCNHPFLFASAAHLGESLIGKGTKYRLQRLETLVRTSGKMALLDKLLVRLKESGHRVLIFSQMVRMLNILGEYLECREWHFQRLDGSMPREERQKAMESFNEENSRDFVFLLSTRAGGLGINLTSADTVIIFDSDWNPQNDLQAQARCHRIGQEKVVNIYRFVTKDTVEENILERAKRKMVLDHLVIQSLDTKQKNTEATQTNENLKERTNALKRSELLHSTSPNGAESYSREELDLILRFNANNIFATSETNENQHEETIDEILSRAEDVVDNNETSAAENLLSNFKVTSFGADNRDDDFWAKLISSKAEAEAEKFEAENPDIIPKRATSRMKEEFVIGPRSCVQRGKVKPAPLKDDEDDEEINNAGTRYIRKTKKKEEGLEAFVVSGARDWKLKETKAILYGLKRFGCVDRAIDIIKGSKVLKRRGVDEIQEVVEDVISTAKKMVKEMAPVDGENENSDNEKQRLTVSYNDADFDAVELFQRHKNMKALSKFLSEQPNLKKFPFAISQKMGGVTSWTDECDLELLKGVHKHGAGNWDVILHDEEFENLSAVAKSSIVKTSHLLKRMEHIFIVIRNEIQRKKHGIPSLNNENEGGKAKRRRRNHHKTKRNENDGQDVEQEKKKRRKNEQETAKNENLNEATTKENEIHNKLLKKSNSAKQTSLDRWRTTTQERNDSEKERGKEEKTADDELKSIELAKKLDQEINPFRRTTRQSQDKKQHSSTKNKPEKGRRKQRKVDNSKAQVPAKKVSHSETPKKMIFEMAYPLDSTDERKKVISFSVCASEKVVNILRSVEMEWKKLNFYKTVDHQSTDHVAASAKISKYLKKIGQVIKENATIADNLWDAVAKATFITGSELKALHERK